MGHQDQGKDKGHTDEVLCGLEGEEVDETEGVCVASAGAGTRERPSKVVDQVAFPSLDPGAKVPSSGNELDHMHPPYRVDTAA
jgi:hypothetical protein